MDVRTLAKVLQEANRLLPQETRDKIADAIEKGAEMLEEFGNAFDEATANSSQTNRSSIYDDVRKDMGDPPNSFDDIVKNFEQEPAPARSESGGSPSDRLNDILGIVYDYVVDTHEHWQDAGTHMDAALFRQDNIRYPEYMLSALEELIDKRDRGKL